MFWAGLLIIAMFAVVIMQTSKSFDNKLEATIYHDLAARTHGYINTIYSTFVGKTDIILSLRDDLERYDTRGQMWVHLASHVGEKVFDDPKHKKIYTESFYKKLAAYKANGQLSADKITPQIQKMLDDIGTKKNAFGDGMKFFYIGIDAQHADKTMENYNKYQDSSLWVPDSRVDSPYNPLIRPWYKAGQKAGRERVLFTEPYAEKRTKEALIAAGTIININGVDGTLAGAISISPIMKGILKSVREDAQIEVFSKGTSTSAAKYIYSSRSAELGDNFKTYNDKDIMQQKSNKDLMALYDKVKDSEKGVVEWVVGDEEKLVAYETVPEVGWKVFNAVSKKKEMADVVLIREQAIQTSVIGVLILLLVIFVVLKFALYPIDKVAKELQEIAETGDLSKRITVTRKDEVGLIARDINQMLDNTAAPVRELGTKAHQIAEGDLTLEIDIQAKGDVAKLVASFKTMLDNLKHFVGEVTENANIAASSAEMLSTSSKTIDTSAKQVAESVRHLEKGAKTIASASLSAKEKSQATAASAETGSISAKQINDNMQSITSSTKLGAEKIGILGEQSKQIGHIVDAIEEISKQTALLALNAAIEAARAGENGRGFAVVADEVRKLATESQEATTKISELISGIQGEIDDSVAIMTDNSSKVDEGAEAVQNAVESFETIPRLVGDVNGALEEMAGIAEENATSTAQLVISSQEVNDSMDNVSDAAKKLAQGAASLSHLASKFRI